VPDFFELPVEGKAGEAFWVLNRASSEYRSGHFDGRQVFNPQTPMLADISDRHSLEKFGNDACSTLRWQGVLFPTTTAPSRPPWKKKKTVPNPKNLFGPAVRFTSSEADELKSIWLRIRKRP